MARLPRLVIPGLPLHLIQRGNNRSPCYFGSDDFLRYRHALYEASRRYGCAIHAYVLMTNHVHLLVTPDDETGPAKMMQMVGRRYVRSFNARHGRSGSLWEGRYRSAVIDSDNYLLTCSRYIELNPVRAGMALAPDQHPWSSYRHNAEGEVDPLITTHFVYRSLGVDAAEQQAAYRALFGSEIEQEVLQMIRRATFSGTVLGGPRFGERIEGMLRRPAVRLQHGGDRRSHSFHQRPYHFSSTLTP